MHLQHACGACINSRARTMRLQHACGACIHSRAEPCISRTCVVHALTVGPEPFTHKLGPAFLGRGRAKQTAMCSVFMHDVCSIYA